jgi:anti-anti-sigma factor
MSLDLVRARQGQVSFEIQDVGTTDPGVCELSLSGNLDADGAPILSEALEMPLSRNMLDVVLDFARVDFISSSGIGALVAAIGEYRDEGGDIRLINVSTSLHRVFEALDLLDYVRLECAEP